jgi:transposase
MARKAEQIILTEEEKQSLLLLSRQTKGEQRMVLRAKIILDWFEGKNFGESQKNLLVSQRIINKWRRRFSQHRIAGLSDAPRSGKPSVISASDKARVIELACSKPGNGYTNWSQRRIAKEAKMSQSKVHQILKASDLKPHKTEYWCGKSPDPEFETKMLTIVGLYMNPPENALVLSVDEKTQIQALDRTQPELPMRTGNPKRQTATYKRNGTVSLIASLAVHTGEITAKTIPSNNAQNFLRFLKKLDRTYRNKTLHIIVDNLAVHKNQTVKEWLSKKRKIKLHFTPTYSSWLNQIEMWFNILSKNVLKGGIWKSSQQLVEQLMDYIKTYNKERAKPFQWNYTGNPLTI